MAEVTAICTTYNRRKFIPAMLASFFSQTFTDSELLVIDDGEDCVQDLIPENPRIHYRFMRRSPYVVNSIADKINMLKSITVGKYIIKFDDDDWSAPGRIEHSLRRLKESGRAVLCYTGIFAWDTTRSKAYVSKQTGPFGAGMIWCHDFMRKQHLPTDFEGFRAPNDDQSIYKLACRDGQWAVADAEKNLVTRAHSSHAGHSGLPSTWIESIQMLEVDVSEIPSGFFAASKEFGL
jgi:glycosyltransferase involved in cell wall biosynthesis